MLTSINNVLLHAYKYSKVIYWDKTNSVHVVSMFNIMIYGG